MYKDNLGFPTIGIGHLIQKGEEKKYTDKTVLSDQEVINLFNSDVADRIPEVNKVAVSESLSQNQADALMDFHFNTGRANEFSKDSKDGYFFLGYMAGGEDYGNGECQNI